MVRKFFMVLLVDESEELLLELLVPVDVWNGGGSEELFPVGLELDPLDGGGVSARDAFQRTIGMKDCPLVFTHLEPPRRLSGKKKLPKS